MNKKEELIWRVIDNVISCCTVTRIDGAKSITREDVVGKSREDDDPQYRSRNPYDDEERYHEREEYGHRECGRYGRY